jgi:hypothetical protein
MNKENAHLYLPLVQALANGKTIQRVLHFGPNDVRWEDVHEFKWTYSPDQYRIKPEPRTWEVWAHKNDKDIIASIPSTWITDDTWKRITVQEVLE